VSWRPSHSSASLSEDDATFLLGLRQEMGRQGSLADIGGEENDRDDPGEPQQGDHNGQKPGSVTVTRHGSSPLVTAGIVSVSPSLVPVRSRTADMGRFVSGMPMEAATCRSMRTVIALDWICSASRSTSRICLSVRYFMLIRAEAAVAAIR